MGNIICQKKVLAVEGKDEVNFFDALLRYVGVTDFKTYDVAGKSQFKNKLPALIKTSGFSEVEVFAVIRDADEDATASFISIKNILKKEGLKPPTQMNRFSDGEPIVGIFIMPGNSDKGMLEDLCLRTVKNHPAMECVNIFSDCISKLENPPNNLTKSKAQAFLAAMPEIVSSVGIGTRKGYWDFDSKELTELISFINNLK